jgi:subtilisin family serine protease
MATPHVAGVGALMKSLFPNKSGNNIREALEATSTDLGACGYDPLHGNGLVNAVAAAAYLNGWSQAALEQSGCYNANISIKTDVWGAETSYVISKKDSGEIVYKGGPYPNSQQATYTDNIQLPPGCYEFKVLDSYGDGKP